MYNDIVLDHFANPRNVGSFPEPDGIGQSGNSADGDKITIYIKVRDGILSDVRFKTFGCGAAIAASSMLTVLAIGRSLTEGLKITNDNVAEALGGLPPQKLLCSNIAADALHAAINDYLEKNVDTDSKKQHLSESDTNDPLKSPEPPDKITDSNQIQRYLRHIIMPNIGGSGQQILLKTRISVSAPSLKTCDILLDYLTSVGIGQIDCFLENKDGWEKGLTHYHDLNPDVTIELIRELPVKTDFNIIVGDFLFATHLSNRLTQSAAPEISPTFIAIIDAWQGCLNLCNDSAAIKTFLNAVEPKILIDQEQPDSEHFAHPLGLILSYSFVGSLLAVELVKARLQLGVVLNDVFYFDLWHTCFDNHFLNPDHHFKKFNYSSHHLKNNLETISVLTIGAGGLGCPANLVLAKAGIKTLGLVDFDHVEISNLNRQILHSTSKIGLLKVESAKQALEAVNPDLSVVACSNAFSRENARELVRDYDLVIDGLDNLPTRYLLNDACFLEKKPLIEAGALAYYGQLTSIIPEAGPCYRCLFPESASSQNAQSCSETGVLGPVPGLMGILQAVEAIKLSITMQSDLQGKLLMYDALETSFDIFRFQKQADCPLCGKHPTIRELGDYSFVCQ